MFHSLFQPEQALAPYAIALAGAFVLGLAKSGLKGSGIFAVTLMALAFGARQSTGQILPLLMFGDLFAVVYYNRHARWDHLKRFLPWMILGILGVHGWVRICRNSFLNGRWVALSWEVCSYGLVGFTPIQAGPPTPGFCRIYGVGRRDYHHDR